MGVPRLFKYIIEHFPGAVRHFKEGEFVSSVDYMYIDANGLLHQAAQIVFNYGQMERRLNMYASLSNKQKITKVYDLFFQKILEITHIICPKKVLYIAIDGPAPLAKQDQQRQRRFVAAKERLTSKQSSSKLCFDSSCITPGTKFMNGLVGYMIQAISSELEMYPQWKGLKIHFSPPDVAGEGEHKCLQFIRDLPEQEKLNCSHCMFGPDGDLLILTLAVNVNHMFLFREDQYEPEHYHYLNMGAIRKSLKSTNDFIAKSFFVGNDFLPKIKMFYLLEDGLDLLGMFTKTLTRGGNITLDGLRFYIVQLAKNEEVYLYKQSKIKPRDPMFTDHTLLACVTEDSFDFQTYRASYYRKAMCQTDKIQKMCHDYLKTLIWVFKYYVHGLPSWTWAYRWHYAPMMSDFSMYLANLRNKEFSEIASFALGSPTEPILQLLSVLPFSSASLLPKPYRKLMKELPGFSIDYEGKVKEYQGVALLPFIDIESIERGYKSIPKAPKPPKKILHTWKTS